MSDDGRWRPHVGNAVHDGAGTQGWFIGHFLNRDDGIRARRDVEIKWVTKRAGERRAHPVTHDTRTTVLILVDGICRIELSTGSFELSRRGDYAMWGPGIDHTWEIIDDSTIVTVRWPSQPPAEPAAHAGPAARHRAWVPEWF